MLAVDASTLHGSVAVIRGQRVVADQTVAMRGKDEERLMPAMAAVLGAAGASVGDVRGIICGSGPGSFTSLRIAASLAKGFAHARALPLFSIPSMALAAVEAGKGRWCLTMDALRGEVYVAAYEWDGNDLIKVAALPALIAERDVAKVAATYNLVVQSANPHARAAAPLLPGVLRDGPVDLARWEPSYGRLAEAQVRWEAIHGPLPT
jgi:tRNA threonylcarbamoyladenosine biosynthesis protein TsaB